MDSNQNTCQHTRQRVVQTYAGGAPSTRWECCKDCKWGRIVTMPAAFQIDSVERTSDVVRDDP